MNTKLTIAAIGLALSTFLSPDIALADGKTAGDVMFRARAVNVRPQESSTTTIGGSVDASNEVVPEIDGTYFLTDNIAFELIAATTEHDMRANGTTSGNLNLGQVTLLPPTLTAQYHFMSKQRFSPYVGAGINYTWFYDATAPGGTVHNISYSDNFGTVLQVGFDYQIEDRWYFNFDIKQIYLHTDATINNGAIKASVDLDPLLVGAGLGYRFSL
jgi:outer membrane protein